MRDNLFLDTEWANDATRELVSLALINVDGTRRFYAERDPLPSAPSTFVRSVVYPLLDRGTAALPDVAFGKALIDFIVGFDQPTIMFHALLDRMQLMRALSWSGITERLYPAFGTERSRAPMF